MLNTTQRTICFNMALRACNDHHTLPVRVMSTPPYFHSRKHHHVTRDSHYSKAGDACAAHLVLKNIEDVYASIF